MGPDELIEKIFEMMREKPGYNADAYLFCFEALHVAVAKKKEHGHVGCSDLVEAYAEHAVAQFGMLASAVLKRWEVHTARDIGIMVFNLISVGLLQARPEDKLEQFDPAYVIAPDLDKRALELIEKTPI